MKLHFNFLAILLALAVLSLSPLSIPARAVETRPRLSPTERESVRFRLQNLFNEADLAIKNQKVNESDQRRIEREFEALRVYDRIPRHEEWASLKQQLDRSAKLEGLKLNSLKKIKSQAPKPARVPESIYSDGSRFQLTEDQVAEPVLFEAEVQGSRDGVRRWIQAWRETQVRYAETEGGRAVTATKEDGFIVKGRAFKFRDIRFPKIKQRDPFSVLPDWAKRDPKAFAQDEPRLWKYVTDTRELAPQAHPLLASRREFLTLKARLEFYIGKTARK